MTKQSVLIYGSYGYTGNLIVELACKQGLAPVLGGRNKEKLIAQAKRFDLDYRVFDLTNPTEAAQIIKEFIAVLHCAGPFIETYKKMTQACLQAGTHYLDINAEYPVYEALSQLNLQAKQAGIMILSGVGWDIVPSDCLTHYLKSKLPDATELIQAYCGFGADSYHDFFSQGTALSLFLFSYDAAIRDQGKLVEVPFAFKTRNFSFGEGKSELCVSFPMGEIVSAWWGAKIPHVETYILMPEKYIKFVKMMNYLKPLIRWRPVRQLLQMQIRQRAEGPTWEMRNRFYMKIYGEVTNESGVKIAALLKTPEGYTTTATTAVQIIKKVLNGDAPIGFQTPALAYTKELIFEIPGTSIIDL